VNRRVAALLVAILFTGVLVSFLIFTREQARIVRADAAVLERLYAISFAASEPTLTREDRDELWGRAGGTVLGELSRLQIPVIITDGEGNPSSWGYVPDELTDGVNDDAERRAFVEALDAQREHIPIGEDLLLHFGEPGFLRRLRWIPFLQAGSLLAVVAGGAWLILTSFRSERERIWSAMARESAHQMGTPLSSLVGWLEVLEMQQPPEVEALGELDLVDEMAADVRRLQKVSRRFELIGTKTTLKPVSVGTIVDGLRRYFQARLPSLTRSGKIEIEVNIGPDAPEVSGNATLLEWAFENLIKNAVDALAPRGGRVVISHLGPNGKRSVYRVRDTGPGVAPGLRDKIFDIGVTTKASGWGVGLSLTRRIIEDMHGGSIQLEDKPGGASFRIELLRAREQGRRA